MRVVFMGTPQFAVPSLESVLATGCDVPFVVTQPDRPKGRKGSPQPPPVKLVARGHGLEVYQPESVNCDESIDKLAGAAPDLIVIAAFGQILRRRVIEAAKVACINVHASLLPKYRGAAPVPAAILNGDCITGVTIQKVVRKLDAGDIIRQDSLKIGPDETAGELAERLSHLGAGSLAEALADLKTGRATFSPQDDSQATFAPMLSKSDGLIDWRWTAGRIARHVRAMTPWPGAFSFLARPGKRLRVTIERVACAQAESTAEPGVVTASDAAGLTVTAGEGAVLIRRLQPAGRKLMTAQEFSRGYRLEIGERFASS